MYRQTLAAIETVFGEEHPSTLTSVCGFAYILGNQHRWDESAALYERTCAGYSTVLGHDHQDTRNCRQNYYKMLESREQHQSALVLPLIQSDESAKSTKVNSLGIQMGKEPRLS
jgi:alpha-D-ribose 1-methylphosphonate 5-triphosphate synthase subunit PhnG